jgi:coenzyme F420 hydrogenase subunit beta
MKLTNGFYLPEFSSEITKKEINQIKRCCPGIHIESRYKIKSIWGETNSVKEAWASNDAIRKKAASGGVISSLAIYLLESDQIDAVLHVGTSEESCLYNEMKISCNRDSVINNAGSRYAPVSMFARIKKILETSNDVYAFIGKPCDIAALRNYVKYFSYEDRFKYYISMFCAGMPSYNGTKRLLGLSGYHGEPYYIKYRGDGWPGYFEARYRNKPDYKVSYSDSWGKVLGKCLGFRCKICPDGIGLLADIVVADSWFISDGLPIFEENDGRSFVIMRTLAGEKLFNDATMNGYISASDFNINSIVNIQRYQYHRRVYIGYKLLAVQIITKGILCFKKMGIIKSLLHGNPLTGIRIMLGTIIRFLRRKHVYVD